MTASFKKILIIDDDEVFVKPLRKFLTLNKFQVNVAENGMNGLELQNFLNVDLVITDLRMEGLTGIDVINNVSKTFPNTPIMVVSGFINDSEFGGLDGYKNVVGVYQKPIDYEKLIEQIKNTICH
ncbi:MAG: response regulator [Spirochaetales bacterium]|nr:response regulator [Spirochaetales bacterium]